MKNMNMVVLTIVFLMVGCASDKDYPVDGLTIHKQDKQKMCAVEKDNKIHIVLCK
jgi:uncharacterized protein YcfL